MKNFKLHVSEKVWTKMSSLIFKRYPDREWATFFKCGWVDSPDGLVVTIQDIVPPKLGELNELVDHVMIDETYSLRVALEIEKTKYGVGFVHSHPEGYLPLPSRIDDDMDAYYPSYFSGFCPERPYVSIIFSKDEDGNMTFSGRAHFAGNWLIADRIEIVSKAVQRIYGANNPPKDPPKEVLDRLDRVLRTYGKNSARELWNSTVAIVGCGGTGSPVAHVLARSCVGRIILIDFDFLSRSNGERVHGVTNKHLQMAVAPSKVEILYDLIKSINPKIEVITYRGSIHDKRAQELIATSDLLFGCTDSHNGRVGVSDAASRFLIPALHVNVSLEPKNVGIEAEVIHITQYGPNLPCAYCRGQVDGQKIFQELMSPEEKTLRIEQARLEEQAGRAADPYWTDEPVVSTVGTLTTAAGGLVANYGVGLLTGAYSLPSTFLEINLLAQDLGVVSLPLSQDAKCICSNHEGGCIQTEALIRI